MANDRKIALLTGASGGIGLEIARTLAARGYDLVITARNGDRLAEVAAEFQERYTVQVTSIPADLGVAGAADTLVAEIEKRGLVIHSLVNNAGFGLSGAFCDTPPDREQQMITLNIMALTRLTKLLLPDMVRRRDGRIMNIASLAAFLPGPTLAVYHATKAYVLSFSEGLSEELRGSGVTVTVSCPGPTASGFQDAANMADSPLFKGKRLPSSKDVAEFSVSAMERGQVVAVHGLSNKLLAQLVRVLPRAAVRRIVARVSKA